MALSIEPRADSWIQTSEGNKWLEQIKNSYPEYNTQLIAKNETGVIAFGWMKEDNLGYSILFATPSDEKLMLIQDAFCTKFKGEESIEAQSFEKPIKFEYWVPDRQLPSHLNGVEMEILFQKYCPLKPGVLVKPSR